VEGTNLTVLAPHDQDRRVAHSQIFHKIVPGIWNPLDAANIEPRGFKNPLALLFE
jgi:hypothetical protein